MLHSICRKIKLVQKRVDVSSFLNQLAGTESAVTSASRPVLEKWLDENATSNALLHNRGEFFQYVKLKFMATTVNQRPTDDHGYVSTSRISYNEWKTQPSRINFEILKDLPNFKPCSVDV